jgi:hypothetical protein
MRLDTTKMIVTGAAQGLGFHFAKRLMEAGGSVAAGDVNEEGLAKLREECTGATGKLFTRRLDVAREADADPAGARLREVEAPAAEEVVRVGAVRDRGPRGGDAVPLGVREVDGVREDGARTEEAGRLVDAEIVGGEGVDGERLDPLARVLGDVRLDREVELAGQPRGALEHAPRAAQGKPWGDGEAEEASPVVAARERARGGQGVVGADRERGRAALVHQGEPEGRAHAPLRHRFERPGQGSGGEDGRLLRLGDRRQGQN